LAGGLCLDCNHDELQRMRRLVADAESLLAGCSENVAKLDYEVKAMRGGK
jgi:hypothetical protein